MQLIGANVPPRSTRMYEERLQSSYLIRMKEQVNPWTIQFIEARWVDTMLWKSSVCSLQFTLNLNKDDQGYASSMILIYFLFQCFQAGFEA